MFTAVNSFQRYVLGCYARCVAGVTASSSTPDSRQHTGCMRLVDGAAEAQPANTYRSGRFTLPECSVDDFLSRADKDSS